MDTLERALREAADLAPDQLVDEPTWTERSWRRGRRQRLARRAVTGVGVAAALLVVAGLVLSMTVGVPRAALPADGGDGVRRDGVTSFPQRIGRQWWVRDLPSSPGPLAGLVEVVATEQDSGSWQALTPDGTRYWLPGSGDGTYPTLSADGTRLGRVVPGGSYVVTDLLTGDSVGYDQVGDSRLVPGSQDEFVGGRPYGLQMQSPGFFSPSGSSLALLAGTAAADSGSVLVLDDEANVIEVDGMGQAAGWLDDDRLLGRTVAVTDPAVGDREVQLVVWDRRTGRTQPLRTLELPDPGPGLVAQLNGQWWGSLRADGTLWLDADVHPGTEAWSTSERWLVGYRPGTGEAVDLAGRVVGSVATEPAKVVDDVQEPPTYVQSWRGTVPLMGTDGQVERVWEDGRILVSVQSDALDVTQVVFAQDAIDGTPTWTPFGSTDLLVLWWWKEIALLVLAIAGWRWWLRRGRVRQQAAAATPASREEP
ncbi:hypothetical protein [Oryzobacter telluris]|uniref:hypothetical protein n=1 Tax=Oryzobacter telluris TaxID=3149179 RepID=UPI00370D0DB0